MEGCYSSRRIQPHKRNLKISTSQNTHPKYTHSTSVNQSGVKREIYPPSQKSVERAIGAIPQSNV